MSVAFVALLKYNRDCIWKSLLDFYQCSHLYHSCLSASVKQAVCIHMSGPGDTLGLCQVSYWVHLLYTYTSSGWCGKKFISHVGIYLYHSIMWCSCKGLYLFCSLLKKKIRLGVCTVLTYPFNHLRCNY